MLICFILILQYDFSGRRDLVRFIKEIQTQGLYASLRIGPFIESEWTYGGLPFWLHDIPGIVYRSDNEPFKFYMQNFTTKIVNMMKSEGLYASQGGPIILSQIENEYQTIEGAFHEKGPAYVRWAAQMAVGLQTGVPWTMCKQIDAPDPVINTCNGMRCGETFVGPNSPNKPAIWTENWTTQFTKYGENIKTRSPEDIAFHVALFIARKYGSFVNYYMQDSNNDQLVLNVTSLGHVVRAFVNGPLVGSAHGTRRTNVNLLNKVSLNSGINNVSLLSVMSGLLTTFDAPGGTDPVVLSLGSMGKGEAWVNGQSIGRYWISFLTPAGTPTQTWYNVPRSFLTPTGNLLVVLDEEYGNPLDISIGTVSITKVCGHVSNSHPPPVISWKANNQISSMYKKKQHGRRSKVQLNCPQKKNISKIIFASFGSPSGDCGSYTTGSCHSPNSRAIVEKNVDVEEELGNMKTNLSFHYQYKDPKTYLLHHFLSNQGLSREEEMYRSSII
ncbi:hypothetical protein TEA_015426 [Camellia sinensis var. sinensis]|uniref:beta-galactosidase n=1 Tax=Camellia sinensis var. sinensis TaxID=542762 RepID=A0A4S4DY47_CAMSN|nr:hypothetical protein TEA_015426 [Camellia sinensis var. sinensis]